MQTNQKTSKLKFVIDILATAFVLYIPYCGIWIFFHPNIPSKPLPLQMKLLLADLGPSVFAIFWLLYRCLPPMMKRFPFISTFLSTPSYKVAALTVLGLLILFIKLTRR